MIEPVFLQPHIFVVFQQGAGGNFLCALLRNLINKSTEKFKITKIGSAHPEIDLKVLGKDYLAFGTLPDDQLDFTDLTTRENYYIDKIKNDYGKLNKPQVVWTHDYSNIPLYQKYFPNSKVLVITQESVKEKLALTCMNVLKTMLAPGSPGPFPPMQWENIKKRWRHLAKQELEEYLKITIDDAKLDFIKENYYDIYKYAVIIKRLEYFQLRHFVDHPDSSHLDVVNSSLFNLNTDYWLENNHLPLYTVGSTHQSFINDNCVQLPFDYVLERNLDTLIECLTQIFGKLDQSELVYITSCFDTYISTQEDLLLNDPVQYVKNLEKAASDSRQLFYKNIK